MFTEETAAVIVSYNPDMDVFGQLLTSLSTQCPAVVIDNGSSQNCIRSLEELAGNYAHVELLCSGDNMGIAHAQNTAANHILKTNTHVRYILMLDHDSIPDENMVGVLMNTFESLVADGQKVAAVGPVLYDPRDNRLLKFHKLKIFYLGKITPERISINQPVVEVDGLNSSGTLIAIDAYHATGGFERSLFIDHVETDWCFRAKAAGYRLYATTKTRLTHLMGDDVCHYWFFGKKRMPYRSPSRHYYIVRNSLLLQKRRYIPVAWKISNLLKLFFTYMYFGCYYHDRKVQRKMINHGIRDGIKGITGKSMHMPLEHSN